MLHCLVNVYQEVRNYNIPFKLVKVQWTTDLNSYHYDFLCASFTIFTCIKAASSPPPEEFEITDNWDFVYLEIIYGMGKMYNLQLA